MTESVRESKGRLVNDRARLFCLQTAVLLAGLFTGVVVVNVLLFMVAMAALVILTVRYGYVYALTAGLVSAGVCWVTYGWMTMVLLLLLVILPAFLMAYKSRVFSSPWTVILWGLIPYFFPLFLLVAFYPDLMAQAPAMIKQTKALIDGNAAALKLSGAQLDIMYASIKKTITWMLRLGPGIFFTMAVGIVLFAYLGASHISRRFGAILPRFQRLAWWKPSEFWLIPLGFTLFFVLLGGSWLKIIGENILVFLVHLYAFYGLCFIDFYFQRLQIPTVARVLLYLLILMGMFFAIPALALLGIIDSRFDFRHVAVDNQ